MIASETHPALMAADRAYRKLTGARAAYQVFESVEESNSDDDFKLVFTPHSFEDAE